LAGIIIAIAAALAYGNNTAFNFIVGANTVKAIISALVLEFGSQALIDSRAIRLLTLSLLGTIIARNGSLGETAQSRDLSPTPFDDIPG
jgi:hypothetical protein